ncbi:MAG: RHS repeat-associated core domain-containing protein, partial [Polyangiaceae bacterium]|nr:RHS repeat-associated core domain-containing protein [Polyangiaceae bacterium]
YNEQYTYDAVGNILELFHQGVGSPAATWTRYYDYGPLDNGIARTNRLRSSSLSGDTENIVPYQAQNVHDNHGNITSMPHLSSITYSPFDQMASASNGTQTTYFVYGGDGQRVRKVYDTNANLIKERIYLGGFEIYRERVSGATQLERQTLHVFDGAQRIAMVETKTVDGGSSVTTPVPKYRFQLTNHLGSAMLEVDEAGLVISYEEYHPYGTSAYRSSNGSAEVSARRYRYTGKERDEETGLYYHGARYYAPWLARWTSADPLGIGADGPGVYNYVSGSPINLVDPSGMEERSTWEQLVFAARAHPSTNGIVRRAENLGALLKGVRQSLDRMDRTDVMLAETLPLDNPYRAELLAGDEENAPSVIDQISEAYSAGDNPAEGVRNVVNIFNPIVIGVEAFTAMMEARDKGDFEEAGRHLPALAGAVAGAYSFATGLIPSLFGGGGGAGPAMALAGGGTATLAVEGPAAAAVGASGGPAGFALGLAISMSVGEGDAAGPASTVTNADRLRADLKLSETLTNKKIVVREPIAPNSTNRPALFDTKTGELIIGKTTDPGHFGVLQNTRLPIEEGRYAGGWVQVDSSGAIVFEAESGTFPWSNPALPHNTLDRIRGTGVTVVQPEY